MKKTLILLLFFGFSVPVMSSGIEIEPDQHYLLLATTKTSTMQKELDEAASRGFRVITGSHTSGIEIAILLEKTDPGSGSYEYLLLATSRTGTMQNELNEAAQAGFRLLPSTMIAKDGSFGGPEVVVLMEHSPENSKRYQYQLLATTRTSTLQKEILQYKDYGFTLAGMVSRDEHIVIMEKEVPLQ